MEESSEPLTMTFVGDFDVGKTCMLLSYSDRFPSNGDYIPVCFDEQVFTMMVDGKAIKFRPLDASASEYQDRIRPLLYDKADVILVCFSIISQDSFESVRSRWILEIKYWVPETPIILVGTKSDLRNRTNTKNDLQSREFKMIDAEQAHTLMTEIGAVEYHECSALTQEGLHNLFSRAFYAGINKPKKKSSRTCVAL